MAGGRRLWWGMRRRPNDGGAWPIMDESCRCFGAERTVDFRCLGGKSTWEAEGSGDLQTEGFVIQVRRPR